MAILMDIHTLDYFTEEIVTNNLSQHPNRDQEEVWSVSTASSTLPSRINVELEPPEGLPEVAMDNRRGSRRYATPYSIPVCQQEPPSPAPSTRRNHHMPTEADSLERQPSTVFRMEKYPSTADIAEYECGEETANNLYRVSNLILLVISLIIIGTGTV